MPPWEKYQQTQPASGPWQKYQQPQEPQGLMARLDANKASRTSEIEGLANQAVNGDISQTEALARSGLKYAQLLPDAAGSVIAEATPNFIKEPLTNAVASIANTAPARAAIGAVNDFSENHPVASGRIGSALDAANLLVPFAKVGGKSVVNQAADAAGDVASKAGGVAASAVLPSVNPGLTDVAGLARKHGIPLSLDQVSDSRALKNVQKISQELPLSGQSGFRQKQMLNFNRALFKTVGVDADMFTQKSMATAFDKVGGEFDNLTRGKEFNIGGEFINDLSQTVDEVSSSYGKEASDIFQKEALKVINDFGSGDAISGELISRQRARINALARKSTDPNIKGALLDLENNIVDGITSRDPAAEAALSTAKQRYKNLIVLEPIANKAKGGFISPALLNQRVSQVYKRAHTVGESGEIGELAKIGHELLPELGGSDTLQKGAYLATIGNAVANPGSLPAVGATLGANTLFQAGINRNQGLVDAALRQAMKLPPAQAKALLQRK